MRQANTFVDGTEAALGRPFCLIYHMLSSRVISACKIGTDGSARPTRIFLVMVIHLNYTISIDSVTLAMERDTTVGTSEQFHFPETISPVTQIACRSRSSRWHGSLVTRVEIQRLSSTI
jgi:hypothetical protein